MSFTQDYYKTFDGLLLLEPGCEWKPIVLSMICKKYGYDLALDTCKDFIDLHPDYELSNDYKFVRRLHSWPAE